MFFSMKWVLRFYTTQGTNKFEVTKFFCLFRVAHLIVEQFRKNQNNQRNYQSDSHICYHVLAFLLAIHGAGSTRTIHDFTIRSVARFLNLSFGSFLKEESIVIVINAIVALNSNHLQFLLRQCLNITLHLTKTISQILLLNL